MIGVFGPLVSEVCMNVGKYNEPTLRAAAVLSLCKMMCTNPDFCEANLRLLFTVSLSTEFCSQFNVILVDIRLSAI